MRAQSKTRNTSTSSASSSKSRSSKSTQGKSRGHRSGSPLTAISISSISRTTASIPGHSHSRHTQSYHDRRTIAATPSRHHGSTGSSVALQRRRILCNSTPQLDLDASGFRTSKIPSIESTHTQRRIGTSTDPTQHQGSSEVRSPCVSKHQSVDTQAVVAMTLRSPSVRNSSYGYEPQQRKTSPQPSHTALIHGSYLIRSDVRSIHSAPRRLLSSSASVDSTVRTQGQQQQQQHQQQQQQQEPSPLSSSSLHLKRMDDDIEHANNILSQTGNNDTTKIPLFHTKRDILGASRTHYISDLNSLPDGAPVTITGWVDRVRPLSALFFIVLRDHTGYVQCTYEKQEIADHDEAINQLKRLQQDEQYKDHQELQDIDFNSLGEPAYLAGSKVGNEAIVSIKGIVQRRPDDMVKRDQKMGAIEIRIRSLHVLNTAKPMPISIHEQLEVSNEDQRMRYRYIDLRRQINQNIIKIRSQLAMMARMTMYQLGFHEIETPALVKSTPEGAREFLVPTRSAGKFFALPQSPQQHKQLLMASGFDRYFQIARCFRDETGRQDRQPEFTQLDLEMSFVSSDHVMKVVETMVNAMHTRAYGVPLPPVRRLRYLDVMNRFGSDKPDLRYRCELNDITDILLRYALSSPSQLSSLLVDTSEHQQESETSVEATLGRITPDMVSDGILSSMVTVFPPLLKAHHSLHTTGAYEHYRLIDGEMKIPHHRSSRDITTASLSQSSQTENEDATTTTSSFKPLARHPFPVVKMIIARDLNDVLTRKKNRTIVDKAIRDCKESSNGLMPTIISCNKWKLRENQKLLNNQKIQSELTRTFNLTDNDMIFIVSGNWEDVCNGLGKIRSVLKPHLVHKDDQEPALVDGEPITPATRLDSSQNEPHSQIGVNPAVANPLTARFPDLLVPETWKTQMTLPAHQQAPLNTKGPLPVFHWVVDFPLFEIHTPAPVYLKSNTRHAHGTSPQSQQQHHDQEHQVVGQQDTDGHVGKDDQDKVVVNAMHHPFTSPNPDDMEEFNHLVSGLQASPSAAAHAQEDGEAGRKQLESAKQSTSSTTTATPPKVDPITKHPLGLNEINKLSQIRALHYDLVSNGLEVGGGSIRVHSSQIQRQVFDLLEVPHDKFNHLLEALEHGCPPHGGFAAGLDRLVAILASETHDPLKLKDVIAFPKSSTGNDLLLGSPNMQTPEQLDEYWISVKGGGESPTATKPTM